MKPQNHAVFFYNGRQHYLDKGTPMLSESSQREREREGALRWCTKT